MAFIPNKCNTILLAKMQIKVWLRTQTLISRRNSKLILISKQRWLVRYMQDSAHTRQSIKFMIIFPVILHLGSQRQAWNKYYCGINKLASVQIVKRVKYTKTFAASRCSYNDTRFFLKRGLSILLKDLLNFNLFLLHGIC